MTSNMLFQQEGRNFFGEQFGYAVEYTYVKEDRLEYIQFAKHLVEAEDPQNSVKPSPIDLVSECLFKLIQEKKEILVSLYGDVWRFDQKMSMCDIKKEIREIQKSFIKIDPMLAPDVKHHLNNGVFQMIKNMPVH